MPVSIPRVGRNKPVASASVGRSQLNVPSDVENVARIGKAVGKVVEDFSEGYEKGYDKQEKKEEKDFEMNAKEAALSIRSNSQDPYNALTKGAVDGSDYANRYLTYQQTIKDQTDYAVKTYGNNPERRVVIENLIAQETRSMNENANEAYFVRDQARKIKITEDSTRNRKNDAAILATKINPSDPKSFEEFDKNLNDIDANIKSLAYHTGATMTGKDGQPIYSDVVGIQSNKSKAEAIQSSVENLLAIGQTDKAKAIYDRYSTDVIGLNKPELTTKITKAVKNKDILTTAENIIKTVPRNQQFEAIEKIEDFEKKKEVADLVNSDQIKRDKAAKQIRDDLYSKAHESIYARQSDPTKRFNTVSEMRNDPKIARMWSDLDSRQKSSLESMVKRPDESDYKTIDKMDKLLETNKIKEVPNRAAFDSMTTGLDSKDYNKYLKEWENSKDQKTKSLGTETRAHILSRAKQQMIASGILKKDGQSLNKKSLKKWQEFQDQLVEEFDTLDRDQYVQNSKVTNDYIKNKVQSFVTSQKSKPFFGFDFFSSKPKNVPVEKTKEQERKEIQDSLDKL
jgi:hypothetical protein